MDTKGYEPLVVIGYFIVEMVLSDTQKPNSKIWVGQTQRRGAG